MAIQRATLFFKDPGAGAGWSESYWKNTSDLAQLLKDAAGLAKLRANMLGMGPIIHYIRVSDDGVRGDSLVNEDGFEVDGGAANKTVGVDNSDMPYSAILLRMEAGANYRKSLYLRGAPDNLIIDPPGPRTDNALFNKAFDAYKKALVGVWGFKTYAKPPDQASTPVTGMSAANPSVINSPSHGLVINDRCLISGTKALTGGQVLHGTFTVATVPDANSFTVKSQSITPQWDRGGSVTKRVPTVQTISNVIIRGETSRKAGAFFGQLRGKRRSAR